MEMLVAIVAVWATYIFAVHTFAWQRFIVREVLASPLPPLVRTTFTVVWHVTTIVLASTAIAVAAYPWSARAFDMATVHVAAFVGLFLVTGVVVAGGGLRAPQWMLLGPLLLAMLGLRFGIPYVAPSLLACIALVHLAWAFGLVWPSPSRASAGAYLAGTSRLPPVWATLTVAGCLFALAASMVSGAGWARWLCVSVFALRFVYGMVERWVRPSMIETPYAWLSLGFYSPLCLFIASLAAVGA